jgi:hypothetical protein
VGEGGVQRYLVHALSEQRGRYLVAMDFGFGYPWGADGAAFGCEGWREMIGVVSETYEEKRIITYLNRPIF